MVLRFIEVQLLLLSPFCPHVTEHLWSLLPGTRGSLIVNACWPAAEPVDALVSRKAAYLHQFAHDLRIKLKDAEANRVKKNAKSKDKALEIV